MPKVADFATTEQHRRAWAPRWWALAHGPAPKLPPGATAAQRRRAWAPRFWTPWTGPLSAGLGGTVDVMPGDEPSHAAVNPQFLVDVVEVFLDLRRELLTPTSAYVALPTASSGLARGSSLTLRACQTTTG